MKQLYTIGGIVLVLIALLFIFARMPGGSTNELDDRESTPPAEEVEETNEGEENLEAAYNPPESMDGETQTITMKTNKGDIVIEMYTGAMPITAGNFLKLAGEDFYDGIKFHRVIDGFMLQGGDPLTKDDSQQAAWGTGDPGYKIQDEFTDNNVNARGTLSMANAGPNTGGSQFFINLVDNNFLDTKHPVFGRVVDGMDVVDAIGKVETNGRDVPNEPIIIEDIVI